MKRYALLLLFSALLLTACGQNGSYSPAVITASQLDLSSVQSVEEVLNTLPSEVASVESVVSSAPLSASSVKSSQNSSVASSKYASSKTDSSASPSSSLARGASSAASSTSPSQQHSTANTISSMKSSTPVITKTQDIEVLSLTSPIVRGQDASITIKGKSDIEYTIKVIYKSGPSTAKGLESKTSEPDGKVTWSWKVSSRTTAGDWSIEVSGDGASVTVPFVVTE